MHQHRGFAAILGLLIVIAIAMMLYFMDLKAIFGPSGQYMERPAAIEDHPWQLEDLLIGPDKNVPSPRKGQPELLEPIHIKAPVHRNDAPRGQVTLSFGKDCRVDADWAAQYESDKKNGHHRVASERQCRSVKSLYRCPGQYRQDTPVFYCQRPLHSDDTPAE